MRKKKKKKMELDNHLDQRATEFFQSLACTSGEVFLPWLRSQSSLSQQQAESNCQGICLIALRKQKMSESLISSINQENA